MHRDYSATKILSEECAFVGSHSPAGATRCFVALTAAIVTGVAIAQASMPTLFRAVRTDMSRTRVLLDALHGAPPLGPKVCVFGSSVVMNGVDARRLRSALPGEPQAWNLGSTGQSVLEGFLLYQELPNSVVQVIHCIPANDLERQPCIAGNKYNAYFMYGYRPNAETLAIVERFGDAGTRTEVLKPAYQQRFDSRWALQSAPNTVFRRLLRKDLTLDRARNDLYFPQAYQNRISPQKLEILLRRLAAGPEGEDSNLEVHNTDFFVAIADVCRAKGIEWVLVILPRHPRIGWGRGTRYRAELAACCDCLRQEHGLRVINAFDLLEEKYFVDNAHPNTAGAEILTDFIARELQTP